MAGAVRVIRSSRHNGAVRDTQNSSILFPIAKRRYCSTDSSALLACHPEEPACRPHNATIRRMRITHKALSQREVSRGP
ncbi:jg7916 [Pararge aegeria aegeria]|uniref:Jg7916 protein n=1 Tax=Pararge aegeria aegeria TaxID=348720 RepID=A0A8S4R5I2_9NEOP|nr:jg7916 [Pararge aegeria aegeria]